MTQVGFSDSMNPLRGKDASIPFRLVGLATSLLALSGGFQAVFGQSAKVATADAQPSLIVPQAIESSRIQQKLKQTSQVRADNYDLQKHPVSDAEEKHWKNILWTTAIVEPQDPFVAQALNGILSLSGRSGLSAAQSRTVDMAFQIGTQLYLSYPTVYPSIGQRFAETVERGTDPRWVAMALSGLAKSQLPPDRIQQLSVRVRQRFPQWSQNPVLLTTLEDVKEQLSPSATPPLKDLLNWTIAPGQMHLYVICTHDRQALCTAVLKNPQGKFVRATDSTISANGMKVQQGQLWSIPLLLRSIHGLGWNFTRGETPQGIYRIEGLTPQPDHEFFRAYGHFSLINLFTPFEAGAQSFLPGRPGPFSGNLQSYKALLPPTWRNYAPIDQSYWAGRIGRGLFRIHGSGEAADFFRKPRSDNSSSWNPTLGCLSALELYDQTGKLQQADMPIILNTLASQGGKNLAGYLIVVEIPSPSQNPVSLEDIEAAL
jgi:hypothetical protein